MVKSTNKNNSPGIRVQLTQMSNKRAKNKNKNNKISKSEKNEVTRLGGALRALGGLAGGSLGSLVGYGQAGSAAGSSLGAAISRWLGSGDYTVSSNSIVQRTMKGSESIPMMHRTNQTVTIRHKEFVCSVKGSTDFQVGRFFLLQPADRNTFPWLSGIASRFQQYKFKGIVFHYIPTSGTAISGTNPTLGTVMLQTTYRVNDDGPKSKAEMMNEYWACEAAPSEAFCHPIECDPRENPFAVHYTRTKPAPLTDSPLMYDIGKLFVATNGQLASGNILGDLWVTYEVELTKPIVESSTTSTVYSAQTYHATPVPGNWFSNTLSTGDGDIPFTTLVNTISFPPGHVGRYLIDVVITAATNFTAMDLSGTITRVNCAGLSIFDAGAASHIRTVCAGATATLNRGMFSTALEITDPSSTATITLPAGTWTGSALTTQVVVTQL